MTKIWGFILEFFSMFQCFAENCDHIDHWTTDVIVVIVKLLWQIIFVIHCTHTRFLSKAINNETCIFSISMFSDENDNTWKMRWKLKPNCDYQKCLSFDSYLYWIQNGNVYLLCVASNKICLSLISLIFLSKSYTCPCICF